MKDKLPSGKIKNTKDNNILSKDEEIYKHIYTAIVEHNLGPDTKLPEDALAETFNVSRTIIRKVLLGLSHDGLVTSSPKRVARVAHPSIQEGKEVFEARRLVEVAAIPLIITNLNKAYLEELHAINTSQIAAQNANDVKSAIRLSGDFHKTLISVTGNNSLYEYLRSLISQSSLIVAVYGSTQINLPSCQGHTELLDLLAANKTEDSQAWMESHLHDIESSLNFNPVDEKAPDFKQLFSGFSEKK